MRYIKNKRSKALLLAVIFSITYLFTYVSYINPLTAFASITGTVTGNDVRVRTSTDTSSLSNVITKLYSGDQVTILDTVNTSDSYAWYHIGFNYNGNYTEGYITSQFVSKNAEYTADTDFEAYLNSQGFPDSYKEGLRNLHSQYPNWVFTADHVSYDWNEVVDAESKTGRSLIYGSAVSSWKSLEPDAYNWETGEWYTFDSGGWVAASKALVAYALDPRNFFNSTNIFMFEKLSYNPSLQSESGVRSIINGTFMQNTGNIGDGTPLEYEGVTYTYPQAIMKAAQESGVSPYHLATRIIQEIGSSGASNSISGTVSGYSGYYNYYNQGAYATSDASAIINGLKYATYTDSATLRPWNSRMKSIIGGAKKIGVSYINKGQDTLYYEKFDLISPYWHQYMTNILAPRSESITSSKAYSDSMKASTALVFTIPVYQNMPESICAIPTGNGSPINLLKSLSVSNANLTPTFDYNTTNYDVIVDNSVTSIDVSAEAMVSTASISGVQTFGLNVGANTIHVVVTAENGDTKTYTINVVRQANSNNFLSSLSVDHGNLSPGFDANVTSYDVSVNNNVSTLNVSAQAAVSTSSISGAQAYNLNVGNNTININVTAENGNTRTYTINAVRNEAANPDNSSGSMSPNSYILNNTENTISGVIPGSNTSEILNGISFTGSYTGKILNADGSINNGIIATGNKLNVTNGNGEIIYDYTFVIYGEVTGDGIIDIFDILNIKRHILGTKTLSGVFYTAADANRTNDEPSIFDILSIKRQILGYMNIKQD